MNKTALYQILQPLKLFLFKKLNFKTDQRFKFIKLSNHLLFDDQIEMFEATMSINICMYAVIYVKKPETKNLNRRWYFSSDCLIFLFIDATVFEMRNNPLGN